MGVVRGFKNLQGRVVKKKIVKHCFTRPNYSKILSEDEDEDSHLC